MYVVTETLLYICFALLFGTFILDIVPAHRKPDVQIPKSVVIAAIVGIVLCSAAQVVRLIVFFMTWLSYDLGFVVFRVLRDYDIGNGWLLTLVLSALLFSLTVANIEPQHIKAVRISKLILLLLLVGMQGWSSHAKAVTGTPGFWSHTFHLLAVSVWIGLVLVIGWYTRRGVNWRQWQSWMSPLALACLLVTMVAGFAMMMDLAPNYRNAWVLNYGQALLVKHFMLLPLLAIAGLNGIYLRMKLKRDPDYNPLSLIKLETLLALLIFITTAYMGLQEPPHDLAETLTESETEVGPSPLFTWFYPGDIRPDMQVSLAANGTSLSLALISALFIILGTWFAAKRRSFMPALGIFCIAVLTGYLAVMNAIV